VLTPEKWHRIEPFAAAKNVPGRNLSLAFGNHPMLDSNSLSGMRIGPAGGVASGENSGHAGFEVFVDRYATIDGEPGLLG
jgi:hypothetical protein